MSFRNNKLSSYWQRRYLAYCLNPNVDWTKPEIQRKWEIYGKQVGRFLSEKYPLTRDELDVLYRAYTIQHSDSLDKSTLRYSLDYQLTELFESGILLVVDWWPFKY